MTAVRNVHGQARLKLSLCVVARNEARFIRACLDSVRSLADEAILVDTGSNDRTADIAHEVGARVIRSPWPGDLGAAHNLPLEHARGTWILSLDADEVLDPRSIPTIRRIVNAADNGTAGYYCAIRNYTYGPADKSRQVDARDPHAWGASSFIPTSVVRLFRRDRRHRFSGRLHQSIAPSIRCTGGRLGRSGLTIHHYGFLRPDRAKTPLYRALCRRQVAAHPESPIAWIEFGTAFSDPPDLAIALDAFRRARDRGDRASAAYMIGSTLLGLRQPAAAIPYLIEARRSNGRHDSPYFDRADAIEQLGLAYEALGRSRDAIRAYEEALDLRPDNPAALNNLAGLLAERGRERRAERLIGTLIGQQPGLDMPWVTLGTIRLRRGDPDGASQAIRRALDINPRNVCALINLGVAERERGRLRVSARAFAAARELHGGRLLKALDLVDHLPPSRPRRTLTRLGRGGVVSIITALYGGAGRVLVDIVRALERRAHLVLCADSGNFTGQNLRAELATLGATVCSIGSSEDAGELVAAARPACVIHHWSSNDPVSAPCRVGDERWIAVGHTPQPLPAGYDDYVILSDYHDRFQDHLPASRKHRIANGVDLRTFRPARRGRSPVTIAMVSRLEVSKFPRRLLAYLPPLGALDAQVVIAGVGSRRAEIESDLGSSAMSDRVRFVGGLSSAEMPAFLRTADIGLHLTEAHEEICSLAILEMLATGLPIVAEPKGSLPEQIRHGHNGFLAEGEDRIAAHLGELIRNPERRRGMGAASRRIAERYAMTRFGASWRRLLASPRASRPREYDEAAPGRSRRGQSSSHSRSSGATPANHVPVAPWLPSQSLFICGTPDSGTDVLARALWATGVAGRPTNYFSDRPSTPVPFHVATMSDRLAWAFDEGSSANGVFASTILLNDLLRLIQEHRRGNDTDADALNRTLPRLRFVSVRRRDSRAQATARPRAPGGAARGSSRRRTDGSESRFDKGAIARHIRAIEDEERRWRDLFALHGLHPVQVFHEDLLSDVRGTLECLLRDLDIEPPLVWAVET